MGKKMAFKRNKVEREEEKEHKDLDHDDEKGEPEAHRIKVLGKKKAEATEKKDGMRAEKKDDKKKDEKPSFTRPAPKPSEKNKKK
jgi:hypothetical protein